MNIKHYLFIYLMGYFSIVLVAQEKLVEIPINQYYQSVEKPSIKSNKKLVELPFIDDFSTTEVYPDPNLWEDQYAFINKFMAVDPPTIGIATLDGLDDEGQPYEGFSVINAPCDTLTSVTINLGNFSTTDEIYFGFFYQAGGHADFPDPPNNRGDADSLILEFKHEAGWDTIWKIVKEDRNLEDFKQVSIKVSDSAKYLIDDFQFRFRNYARPAGHNDFWHIDYVRLEEGTNRTTFNDQAFVSYPTSIIHPYTQMTFEQFLFQQDTAYYKNNDFKHSVRVGNLQNENLPANFIYDIKLPSINNTLFTSSEIAIESIPALGKRDREITLRPFTVNSNEDANNYNIIPAEALGDTVNIQVGYDLRTQDIRLQNNKVTRNYTFSNQLAYDDGIADYAYAVDGESAEFAQRYVVYERDDLFGLMIHFARIENNQSNRLFSIKIWDQIEGVDDSDTTILLYPKKNPLDPYAEPELLNVEYPVDYNHSGFRLYCFDQQISVSDTFYVGIQQSGNVGILVGFDKNTQAGNENLYYNIFNEWTPSSLEGSVMFRPVFDKDAGDCEIDIAVNPVTSVASYLADELEIFPNPTNNYLSINFEARDKVEAIEILDASGRLMQNYDGYVDRINVSDLTHGVYFIKVTVNGKFGIKKFIKSN